MGIYLIQKMRKKERNFVSHNNNYLMVLFVTLMPANMLPCASMCTFHISKQTHSLVDRLYNGFVNSCDVQTDRVAPYVLGLI